MRWVLFFTTPRDKTRTMEWHKNISDASLHAKIRTGEIRLGGNEKLKIYGLLCCISGKRMKRENRVFFATVQEALKHQYRPCGHCLKANYVEWKEKNRRFGEV